MDREAVLKDIQWFVENKFAHDATGHDNVHMKRVALWARTLAEKEGADAFLSEVAGWLHDVGDDKMFDDPEGAIKERNQLLNNMGFSIDEVNVISDAITTVSFRKGRTPNTKVGAVVQDADRLDAIGAVGIARTFTFGGARGQPIYDKNRPDSIDHFHEKLLKLKGLMNTESGKREAEYRHRYMLRFLDEFQRELMVISEGE